ncbi:MAG: hypothetical protein DCF12_22430 [Snowella sp.]|nr:MAG: hypothetical protein DCF12_22430 [Snowella sp.]
MNASNRNTQNESLNSQQSSQDNLNKINKQFQDLLNKTNINHQDFQTLKKDVQGIDSKITQIQNKPFNFL